MSESMTNRRIKPTLQTLFHIDYDWWARDDRDLRVYLLSHLPNDRQEHFSAEDDDKQIDWIDPETAEVRRVDGLMMALQEASEGEEFITTNTSMVDAIFRVFIANNNQPMTPTELSEVVGHPAQKILRTLAGARVYKGIRPVTE